MTHKKIQISIPKPCSEDWSKMTPTERGRFCAMCTKEVVDFTKMNTNETIYVLEKTPNLCGRFYAKQLDKDLISLDSAVSKRSGFHWLDKLVAASLVLFTVNSIKAQGASKINDSQVKEQVLETIHEDSNKIETPKNERVVIRGSITDIETLEPVAYAQIMAQNTEAGCLSDLNGKFELVLPASFQGDSLILLIKFVGYLEQRITIYRKDFSQELDVKLDAPSALAGEVVVIGGVRVSKWKRFWYRMKFWRRRK